jgi:hypothetical protein
VREASARFRERSPSAQTVVNAERWSALLDRRATEATEATKKLIGTEPITDCNREQENPARDLAELAVWLLGQRHQVPVTAEDTLPRQRGWHAPGGGEEGGTLWVRLARLWSATLCRQRRRPR